MNPPEMPSTAICRAHAASTTLLHNALLSPWLIRPLIAAHTARVHAIAAAAHTTPPWYAWLPAGATPHTIEITEDGITWTASDRDGDDVHLTISYDEWPFDAAAYTARTEVLVAEATAAYEAETAARAAAVAAKAEAEERATYERLKAKYGATEPPDGDPSSADL